MAWQPCAATDVATVTIRRDISLPTTVEEAAAVFGKNAPRVDSLDPVKVRPRIEEGEQCRVYFCRDGITEFYVLLEEARTLNSPHHRVATFMEKLRVPKLCLALDLYSLSIGTQAGENAL